jgi:hypothetical protein
MRFRPGTPPEGGTMTEVHSIYPRVEDVVLDIGGDIGALVLYTNADRDGEEIELSRAAPGAERFHNQVHERRFNGRVLFAAVYPEVEAGEYHIWGDGPDPVGTVTIRGGAITELDWR